MANRRKLAVISFYLTSLECGLAIIYLYRVPTDVKNIWMWGLSAPRLISIVAMFSLGVLFYMAAQHTAHREAWTVAAGERLTRFLDDRRVLAAVLIPLWGIFLLTGYIYLLILAGAFGDFQAPLERLAPIFIWVCIVCLQYGVFFYLAAPRHTEEGAGKSRQVPWSSLVGALALAAGLWAAAGLSGLGINPDVTAWGTAGTPLLFWQVLAALAISTFGLWLCLVLPGLSQWKFFTPALFGLLWLAASIFWMATPMKPSYFALQPVPPNAEYYPYSDAAVHDLIAQQVLIGERMGGGGGKVVRRPLYALFLAGIHLVAGQDYLRAAALQVLILAFFPALVFLIGGLLHSRLGGFLAAVFLIIQEHNSILLSGVINVSHSKLFMSDLPSALLMAVFTLLVVVWLRRGGRGWRMPLVAGGFLGALMLIRPQAAVLAVVPAILLLFYTWRKPLGWFSRILLFGLGLALCITPWIWRNWPLTGGFVFDEPSDAQIGLVAQRYTLTPLSRAEFAQYLPNESPSQYSARMTRSIVQFALSHPAEVASFAAAHFMHNLVNLTATLPLSPDDLSLEGSVRQASFWLNDLDDGKPSRPSFPSPWMTGLNLVLIALGIAGVWGRSVKDLPAGLAPLLIYLFYDAGNALARNSGWRFMQPVDWIGWLFFAIGISQIMRISLCHILSKEIPGIALPLDADTPTSRPKNTFSSKIQWILIPAVILLAGAMLPISEHIFPRRYAALDKTDLLQKVEQYPLNATQRSEMEVMARLITDEKVYVLWGRALYPRFYKTGQGLNVGSPSPLTRIQEYNRLTFELIGPRDAHVVLVSQRSPAVFPNAADVFAFGCYGSDAFYPYLVVVNDARQPEQVYFYSRGNVSATLCMQ